jgi:hypothetical protein
MKNKLLFTVTFLLLILISAPGWAAVDTHIAKSASYDDVKEAVDAASAGDTVIVPAGTATWSSSVEITKAISVIGAGSDKTILTANGSMFVLQKKYGFFWVHGFSSTQLVRISGFRFEMIDWKTAYAIVVGWWDVALDNVRIDHNRFNYGNQAIEIGGSKGVIDHNYFYDSDLTITYTAGSRAQADASWDALVTGTEEPLFIEDNYFVDDNNIPANYSDERIGTDNGGKLVVRYNHWDSTAYNRKDKDGTYFLSWPFMTHGNASGGSPSGSGYYGDSRRGQSIVEFYNNTIAGCRLYYLVFRGSSNLIHDNTITTLVGRSGIFLREEEYTPPSACEQFCPPRTQWPAEDQVFNTYIWNNTVNGTPITNSDVITGDSTEAIHEGRDYFMHAPQATGGMEVFTARHGAAGSYPTDGSVAQFPYTGTMIFVPTGPNAYYPYTPYPYPHPLTRGDSQTLALTTGWNWISFNVTPSDLSLNSVFAGILGQVEQVKAQTQSAIRSGNTLKGDLANMQSIGSYKMYKVKVSAACTLTVTGTAVPSANPIHLGGGWNWVAYLPTTTMPIATALASINGQVKEVKSLTQSAIYNGTSWSGTLVTLEPGQGYAIKMNAPGILSYPVESFTQLNQQKKNQ